MGPPSRDTRRAATAAALSEDTQGLSINQGEGAMSPPPMALAPMMPPMASPMPPSGACMTPATGGKAPATATGGYLQARSGPPGQELRCSMIHSPGAARCPPPTARQALPPALPRRLQVSSLQVYDELLEAALRAVGCGPRNLALHGPWVWLLDRFCEAFAVGRNYARLSYLKWVVRPENATLTADCFDVLLRDMVALQQAAGVEGLSSGELGVQAQVGGPAVAAPWCAA